MLNRCPLVRDHSAPVSRRTAQGKMEPAKIIYVLFFIEEGRTGDAILVRNIGSATSSLSQDTPLNSTAAMTERNSYKDFSIERILAGDDGKRQPPEIHDVSSSNCDEQQEEDLIKDDEIDVENSTGNSSSNI